MPIDLTEFSAAINAALEEGSFCVVATCGQDGPDIGFKGSMQVFDQGHLCYWERTRGQHLVNLRSDPRVAVMYFNRERGKYLRMYGRAQLHEGGPLRDQIMAQVPCVGASHGSGTEGSRRADPGRPARGSLRTHLPASRWHVGRLVRRLGALRDIYVRDGVREVKD